MPGLDQFEHFQVLRRPDGSLWELGRGAMGVTYKAFDTNLRCDVALKVISPEYLNSDTVRQRFVREARAAAQLRHPNVATVFHLGRSSGGFFYAMEYVEGETLEHRVQQEGTLQSELALQITRQITRALMAADKQKLVHRDIKPSNVMLLPDGEDHLLVKVIDFGLAKRLTSGADQSATAPFGGFVGTPHFASPEQLEERDVDIRSDIYSLGATLFFMLIGTPPYQGSLASVIHQHLGAELPDAMLTNLDPSTVPILRKCLAKNPDDRFQAPADLKQALDKALFQLEAGHGSLDSAVQQPKTVAPAVASIGEFAIGEVFKDRYEILGRSPLDDALFEAKDRRSAKVLTLRLSPQSNLDDTRDYDSFRAEISRLCNIHHPNLTEVYGVESSERGPVLLSESVRGFSFRNLIQQRRRLEWEETVRLVRPLAKVLDFLSNKLLLYANLKLSDVYVEPAEAKVQLQGLLRSPVNDWPPFLVKVDTLSLGTIRQVRAPMIRIGASADPDSIIRSAPQQLAGLIVELQGGASSQTKLSGRDVVSAAVPGISESGNEVLRTGSADPNRFRSASEFLSVLEKAATKMDGRTPSSTSAQFPTQLPPPIPGGDYAAGIRRDGSVDAPESVPTEVTKPDEPEVSAEEESIEELPRTSPLLLRIVTAVAGVIVLLALAAVLLVSVFFRRTEQEKPTVHEGFVSLTTKPDGSNVRLKGGRELGKTPLVKYQLPAGKQVLEIESPGYQVRSVEVDVTNDSTNNLGQIVLVRDVGEFVVKTTPSGIPFQLIDADNKVTSGVTPLTVQNMPSGKYQVKFQRPGWPDALEEAELKAGASVTVQHAFQGINVSIKSDPSGATIYSGEKEIGKTPLSCILPSGQVDLTSKIGSLAPVTKRVTPDPNGTSVIEFKHAYGLLSITVDRTDAEVFIGGIDLGHPPIEGILPPGRHQVVVKVDGSTDQVRTADVQLNHRQVMQFEFAGGASDPTRVGSVDKNSAVPQKSASPPPASPAPVKGAKPTNSVFYGNTFPTNGAKPNVSPSVAPARPDQSAAPVYRTREEWERAKKEAFRKFDSDWNTRKDAMKQQKKYLEYWIDHSSGPTKDQWKSKKQQLEDQMDRLDEQRDQAKDDLKRKWND
jgi:serine/threonine protein kinase